MKADPSLKCVGSIEAYLISRINRKGFTTNCDMISDEVYHAATDLFDAYGHLKNDTLKLWITMKIVIKVVYYIYNQS